jgi:hypothetical protein
MLLSFSHSLPNNSSLETVLPPILPAPVTEIVRSLHCRLPFTHLPPRHFGCYHWSPIQNCDLAALLFLMADCYWPLRMHWPYLRRIWDFWMVTKCNHHHYNPATWLYTQPFLSNFNEYLFSIFCRWSIRLCKATLEFMFAKGSAWFHKSNIYKQSKRKQHSKTDERYLYLSK